MDKAEIAPTGKGPAPLHTGAGPLPISGYGLEPRNTSGK